LGRLNKVKRNFVNWSWRGVTSVKKARPNQRFTMHEPGTACAVALLFLVDLDALPPATVATADCVAAAVPFDPSAELKVVLVVVVVAVVVVVMLAPEDAPYGEPCATAPVEGPNVEAFAI
jgi:hypothetical protein